MNYPTYKIQSFDNLRRRRSELSLKRFLNAGIDFIHGDIRNIEDLKTLIKADAISCLTTARF
jgi:CDP-paratose 2-epimerase